MRLILSPLALILGFGLAMWCAYAEAAVVEANHFSTPILLLGVAGCAVAATGFTALSDWR